MSFFPERKDDEKFCDLLAKFSSHVTSYLDLIFQHLAVIDEIQDFHEKLFFSLSSHCSVEQLSNLVKKQYTNTTFPGLNISLRLFDIKFQEVMNRSGGDTEQSANLKQFLVLSLLNADRTVDCLVNEAIINPGQIETISNILLNLMPICCRIHSIQNIPVYLDTGTQSTYLGNVLSNLITIKREKELENCIRLFQLVRNENNSFAQEVFSCCLSLILQQFCNHQVELCCIYLDLLLSCVHNNQILSKFKPQCLTFSEALGCYLLNNSNLDSQWDIMRPSLIKMITQLTPVMEDKDLSLILSPDLMPYFCKTNVNSLLSTIQYSTNMTIIDFAPLQHLTEDEIVIEVITCMIFLTRDEYQQLFQALKSLVKISREKVDIGAKEGSDPEHSAESNIEVVQSISRSVQILIQNQSLDQDMLMKIVSGYSSLYTTIIQSVPSSYLISLYYMLVQDIFILQELSDDESSGVTSDLASSLWRSCQAVVAELLQQLPKQEVLSDVIVHLAVTRDCPDKQSIVKMMQNYFDKL